MTELEALRNLGPVSARRLREAGVVDAAALERAGAAAAFVAVRANHAGETSVVLLWALDGALRDVDWRDLTPSDKARLLDRVDRIDAAGA